MLIQFNFANFKSFRDEATLDMTATRITENANHVVEIGGERLLPAAAIYGANASGKSNVVEAFRFMRTYVVNSFAYGDKDGDRNSQVRKPRRKPFLFDGHSISIESVFEVYFIDSSDEHYKTINYGFCIDDSVVTEEWLNIKAKTAKNFKKIFRREGKIDIDFSGIAERAKENIKISLSDESLIVSLGAKLQIPILKKVRDWFANLEFANYGDSGEDFFWSRSIPDGFATNATIQNDVVSYLSTFDQSIKGFEVKRITSDNDSADRYKIYAIHDTVNGKRVKIPFEEESAGTLKMFALYPSLNHVMRKGTVFVVDELDSKLHPLLVRNLIQSFSNPKVNKNHAQIVFTTHDPWQLDNGALRRDEIWMTEKADDGTSSLYSLADFEDDNGTKIRKDENYEKNYLVGKYGGIPSLKSIDMLGEAE